jgi:hypothetical protein
MEKVGFIKNWEALQEDYRNSPLGFENEIDKFSTYIDKLPNSNAVLGFIGSFGSGKSNLLEGVKAKNAKSVKWVQFDAWKYPERDNLWENFTLEIAEGLFPKQYKKFSNRLIGKIPWREKGNWLADSLSGLINILYPGSGIVPSIAWKLFGGYKQNDSLKRLRDLQLVVIEIFKKYTEENNKPVYIVIEDIDRSNDAGIFFLETLNHLLRGNKFSQKIITIIPIGSPEYSDNIDSYAKCLDFIYFSQLPRPDIRKFIQEVFDENIFSVDEISQKQINRFLVELIDLPDGNMRKIKLLLRDAAIIYSKIYQGAEKENYDWRMIISFVAMKYFKCTQEGYTGSYAQFFQKRNMEFTSPFPRLFLAIVRKKEDLNPTQGEYVARFKFDESVSSSLPVVIAPEQSGQRVEGKIGLHYREIMMVN